MLDIVKERRKLLNTVLKKKKQWLGHILRGESLVKKVIEGRMDGREEVESHVSCCWMKSRQMRLMK